MPGKPDSSPISIGCKVNLTYNCFVINGLKYEKHCDTQQHINQDISGQFLWENLLIGCTATKEILAILPSSQFSFHCGKNSNFKDLLLLHLRVITVLTPNQIKTDENVMKEEQRLSLESPIDSR